MRLIDCPECDRVCYDHTIFDVGEPDLANVAEVQRRHWLDKAAEKKAGADNYDTAYNMTAYRYVREAFVRAIGEQKVMRVVDFGCGPGATITYLSENFPGTQFSYLGFEPNRDFAERARAVASQVSFDATIRSEDADSALKLDRPWGETKTDLFLALGTLCYVHPHLTRMLFSSLRGMAERIIVRDYLGNREGASEAAIILYHKHFPMFAHPYRRYLNGAGFEIQRVSSSIAGPYDGRHWEVLEAGRDRDSGVLDSVVTNRIR
ncbi:MAG: methyltransferase domain-containing protein [Rhodospirillaceae bacterium]|nr:methyltransferase domain-containing protein [Rhodospirillaceae bacterium]